jgi:hypothetical protein
MWSRWFGPLLDVRLHLSVAVLVIGWAVKDTAPPAVDVVGDAPLAPAPPRLVARPGAGEADARRAGAGSEVRWDEGPRRGPDQGVGDESVVAVERPVEIGSQSAPFDAPTGMIRLSTARAVRDGRVTRSSQANNQIIAAAVASPRCRSNSSIHQASLPKHRGDGAGAGLQIARPRDTRMNCQARGRPGRVAGVCGPGTRMVAIC